MKQGTIGKRQRFRWINIGRSEIFKGGSVNKRMTSIDGWRAIVALGVLCTHTWAMLKFPDFLVAGIAPM